MSTVRAPSGRVHATYRKVFSRDHVTGCGRAVGSDWTEVEEFLPPVEERCAAGGCRVAFDGRERAVRAREAGDRARRARRRR